MDIYDIVFSKYELKTPFTALVRATLQRLMPASQLDKLFNDVADRQYQRTLLFSTTMELMFGVVLGTHSSLHNAYLDMQEKIPVSLKSVYNKINCTEPNITAKLVQYSAERLLPIQSHLLNGKVDPALRGYKTRIIDGNHFSATEHRLLGTRDHQASPLPGFALAILDPDYRMIVDLIPCEDGHAQERSLLHIVADKVQKGELWIADRNFATLEFMFAIASKGACFIMRQHGSLKHWQTIGKEKYAGKTDSGKVYEQKIIITDSKTQKGLAVRRIRLVLFEPTSDGETEIVLLTNLRVSVADALKCCNLYRGRWGIEAAFGEMTTCLSCEIKTLAYPKAALLAFALAAMVYNAVAVVKGAIISAHGEAAAEQLSWYYVYTEVSRVWTGMEVVLPYEYWSEKFDNMKPRQYADYLESLARSIDVYKFQKKQRGPKKKVKMKFDPNVNHVSTFKIINDRK